jgi:hypothetical protein
MYLGIDFLISPEQQPYVAEVNVGLPGGAQEYHLTHLVHFGKPSDIFSRIEETSKRVYGRAFKEYIHSLPFVESLKPFKIWMDGMGPFPDTVHPGLRLEDKWIQYQLIQSIAPMPETMVFDPQDLKERGNWYSNADWEEEEEILKSFLLLLLYPPLKRRVMRACSRNLSNLK